VGSASVSVFLARAVIDAVERTGTPAGSWLPPDWPRLEHPHARVDSQAFGQLLANAVEVTGDEALGLHLAEHMPESAADLLAHLAAHAPTMREALATCAHFAPLGMDGLGLSFRDEGSAWVVTYDLPRRGALPDRVLAEWVTAGLVRLARTFNGPNVAPDVVRFEHSRPTYLREYARVFGDNVQFVQRETSVAFDRRVADRPQMHQHRELYDLLRVEAARRLEELVVHSRSATRVRHLLGATQPGRFPTAATAARHLGMSERSLRRSLAMDGTSYRDIARTALEASAGQLLRDPNRSIKQTSADLGFASAGAFQRAFKRWTGMTPGEYQRRARGKP
jgi:AraC-like DNA-binding protein